MLITNQLFFNQCIVCIDLSMLMQPVSKRSRWNQAKFIDRKLLEFKGNELYLTPDTYVVPTGSSQVGGEPLVTKIGLSSQHPGSPVQRWIRMPNYAHDDIIKWKHFPHYWSFVRGIHWSPVNSPHKGLWRGALMLSLIWAWISGWINNREAGNLRRLLAHYDVIVMVMELDLIIFLF